MIKTVVKLDSKKVVDLFATCKNQGEATIAMYQMVFPDWEEIKSLEGYPKSNPATANTLMRKFMELDRIYHPNVMAGGCWLNSGFSQDSDSELKDWEVDLSSCVLTY